MHILGIKSHIAQGNRMQTVTVVALGCDSFKPVWMSSLIQAMQAHKWEIHVIVYISELVQKPPSAGSVTSHVTAWLFKSPFQAGQQ